MASWNYGETSCRDDHKMWMYDIHAFKFNEQEPTTTTRRPRRHRRASACECLARSLASGSDFGGKRRVRIVGLASKFQLFIMVRALWYIGLDSSE
jgi:hypothetical protein